MDRGRVMSCSLPGPVALEGNLNGAMDAGSTYGEMIPGREGPPKCQPRTPPPDPLCWMTQLLSAPSPFGLHLRDSSARVLSPNRKVHVSFALGKVVEPESAACLWHLRKPLPTDPGREARLSQRQSVSAVFRWMVESTLKRANFFSTSNHKHQDDFLRLFIDLYSFHGGNWVWLTGSHMLDLTDHLGLHFH